MPGLVALLLLDVLLAMLRDLNPPQLLQTQAVYRILLGELQAPLLAQRLREKRVLYLVLVLVGKVY